MRKFLRIFVLSLTISTAFFVTQNSFVKAQDFVCGESDYDGLETRCIDTAMENDDGRPSEYSRSGQYYKCIDVDNSCGTGQRCCINPQQGQYGGKCFNPELSREDLGVGGRSNFFDFLRPQNCDINEDEPAPAGLDVIIELEEGEFAKQMAKSAYRPDVDNNNYLEKEKVSEGGPVFSVVLNMRPCGAFAIFCSELTSKQWFYEVRMDGKRAFFYKNTVLQKAGDPSAIPSYIPASDPRTGLAVGEKTGCWFANAVKSPFFRAARAVSRTVTNSDNVPDIALLCGKGTPVFTKPDAIDTSVPGKISIKDIDSCYCSDSTSSPANASVLLCTRFILGVGDNTPWRSLIPEKFMPLLFGGITETKSIQEMRAGVKKEIDDFFNDHAGLVEWIETVHETSKDITFEDSSTLRIRLFGEKYENTRAWLSVRDGVAINSSTLADGMKKNHYANEFISCLSCAQYGGFQSALGCMPMDRVERFISEGLLAFGISIAGAFCLLCVIYGALLYQFSMGESAKIQKAQKLIVGCLAGLMVIVFALFILKFVGVDLLRIPGLS